MCGGFGFSPPRTPVPPPFGRHVAHKLQCGHALELTAEAQPGQDQSKTAQQHEQRDSHQHQQEQRKQRQRRQEQRQQQQEQRELQRQRELQEVAEQPTAMVAGQWIVRDGVENGGRDCAVGSPHSQQHSRKRKRVVVNNFPRSSPSSAGVAVSGGVPVECSQMESTGFTAPVGMIVDSGASFRAEQPPSHGIVRVAREEAAGSNQANPAERESQDLINSLPDEVLCNIFAELGDPRNRSVCALVCMKWLMLQSHMRWDWYSRGNRGKSGGRGGDSSRGRGSWRKDGGGGNGLRRGGSPAAAAAVSCGLVARKVGGDGGGVMPGVEEDREEREDAPWLVGDLSRCLEGRKATDVKLAALALGMAGRGGLGSLVVRVPLAVSNVGLSAIGSCCGALESLSLFDCNDLGDEGLASIGMGCKLIEKLHLFKCPRFGNNGIKAIAKGCPLLRKLIIDSCYGIGDEGLEMVGCCSRRLFALTVSNCEKVGNVGIGAVAEGCIALRRLTLNNVGVGDDGLLSLGKRSKSLTKLTLVRMGKLSEEGLVALGTTEGLKGLRVIVIQSCGAFSNRVMEVVATGCNELKRLCLDDCTALGSEGVKALVKNSKSLEALDLGHCPGVSPVGFRALLAVESRLQSLWISNCNGIRDRGLVPLSVTVACTSLKSLHISSCPLVGTACLAAIGRSCPSLENIELTSLPGVGDRGIAVLAEGCGKSLKSIVITACSRVTDGGVHAMLKHSASKLVRLTLDGCPEVTDKTARLVAEKCSSLKDLDLSRTAVTDEGVVTIATALQKGLETLSFASCPGLSNKCIPRLFPMFEQLWALNLRGCSGITKHCLESVERKAWECAGPSCLFIDPC